MNIRLQQRRGFTLIELLVVIAIITVLAAILFPVFQSARKRSLSTVCVSNLRQIGLGIQQYADDYDDMYPNAVDPSDKYTTTWEPAGPTLYAEVQALPLLTDVLAPYITSPQVWHCPCDDGYRVIDTNGVPFNTVPSVYANPLYRMSYFSRTEIVFDHIPLDQITAHDNANPPNEYSISSINLIMDGCGSWHGDSLFYTDLRYNVLLGDGHAESMNNSAFLRAWDLVINR
jgi:prepilin-type N-terminal cleavage/methylation domain-containing protein